MLKFVGCSHFRLRLVLSCLTGRSIRIQDIRADDESPGLRAFEASFLRLVEKVSNGCVVEINETGNLCGNVFTCNTALPRCMPSVACAIVAGTELRFRPGIVIGGYNMTHDCGKDRGIGYFLEPLCILCLFGKQVSHGDDLCRYLAKRTTYLVYFKTHGLMSDAVSRNYTQGLHECASG